MYIHYSHSGLSLVCPVVFTLHIEGVFHVYLGVLFDCVSILFRCVFWSSSICSYTKVIPVYIPINWYQSGVLVIEFLYLNMEANNISRMISLNVNNWMIWKPKMEDLLYCKDLYGLL